MGLSTSKQTSRSNQTQTENQQTSATQMPIVPANLQAGLDLYLAQIGRFGGVDPASLVSGASPLQQQAWSQAADLGGWQGQATTAARLAQQAGQSGPNQGGDPARVAAQGYAAPTLAAPMGYDAARAGAPPRADAQGYGATMAGAAAIGPVERAQASDAGAHSLLAGLDRYISPYTQQVVDTALAGYDDQAQRTQAAQAAQAARNGAFGGSRYALREAQTESELARGRAATEAGLRDRAFQAGAGLSADDADRRQQAAMFNAGQRTSVDAANAAAANARALAQAGFDQQAGLRNADAATQAAQYLAGSRERTGLADAELASRHALDLAGRSDAASQFGAAGANQFAALQAQAQAEADRFAAEMRHRADAINAAAADRRVEFNAGQGDARDARALQAAQILGGLASDGAGHARADLQAQAALGDQQRGVAQAEALAQPAYLQMLAQLYGGLPYDALVGRSSQGTSSGSASSQGTNVTRSTPSLFQSFLDLGNMLSNFKLPGLPG